MKKMGRVWLLAVAGAFVLALAIPVVTDAQGTGWIDVHTHLVGGLNARVEMDYPGAAAAALRVMDQAGIRAMIVMPQPQPANAFPYDESAQIAALKNHPGRFFHMGGGGGGGLGPMILADPDATTVDEVTLRRFTALAESILDAGAVGFGEMTAHHLSHLEQHSYHRARPDHPLFLVLADIAARRNVAIDLHMDPVVEAVPPLARIHSSRNPPMLVPNVAGFERLLAHNRAARIVWAHAGWDQTGQWSVELSRRLLTAHPNLFMSVSAFPTKGQLPNNLMAKGRVQPQWERLIAEFSDRFVIGSDRFFAAPFDVKDGASAMAVFSQAGGVRTEGVRTFLAQLPAALARKIASENAERIYRLREHATKTK